MQHLWVVGDNFVASTYRNNFKKAEFESFMKREFEATLHCSSRFSDANSNLLSRLQITVANAINSSSHLLHYIIIVLDDEIIDYLKFRGQGVASLYGSMLEWIALEMECMIEKRKEQLPHKAQDTKFPFLYFAALRLHDNFNAGTGYLRNKFNLCLESVMKTKSTMRLIWLKEIWDSKCPNLVINNRITEEGLHVYWRALAAAVRFNINKRKAFLVKEMWENNRKKLNGGSMEPHRRQQARDSRMEDQQDEVKKFFQRKRKEDFDQYSHFHWSAGAKKFKQHDARFLLPKLKHRH